MMDGQPMSAGSWGSPAIGPRRGVSVAVSVIVVALALVLAAPTTSRIGGLLASDSADVGTAVASQARVAEATAGAFLPALPMVSARIEEALERAERTAAEARARAGDREDAAKVASESKVSSSGSSVSSDGAEASSEVRSSSKSSSGSSKSGSSVSVSNSSSASASSSGSSVSSSGSSTARVSSSQEVSGDEATCYAESYTSAEISTPDGVVSDSDHDISRTC